MYEQQISDTWRTPLGSGIPTADRAALTAIIAAAYNQFPNNQEHVTPAIVRDAWRLGHSSGAASGSAATGQLIRKMAGDRIGNTAAQELAAIATHLVEDAGVIARALAAAQPPVGLDMQLHWSRPDGHPLAGVAVAAQAWRHGNAAGIAAGGLHATILFDSVRRNTMIDGLPPRQWLDLALTPVHERFAAHHGLIATTARVAGVPARLAMQASPAAAEEIAAQARRIYNGEPEATAAGRPQVARVSFSDNLGSAEQITPESPSVLPRNGVRERGGR